MSEQQFFALRDDLLPILEAIESKEPIRYALMDRFLEPHYPTYSSGAEIPDLCIATHESAIACPMYLIYKRGTNPVLRLVTHTDRENKPIGKSYHLDQLENPDTVVLHPSSLWKGEILLYGSVRTVAWSDDWAKKLCARFQAAIRKQFKKVSGYYFAPGAFEMLKAGKRLTLAEQTPKTFDVSLDSTKSRS